MLDESFKRVFIDSSVQVPQSAALTKGAERQGWKLKQQRSDGGMGAKGGGYSGGGGRGGGGQV